MLFTQIKIKHSSPMKFNDRMKLNQLIFLFRKKTLLFIEIIFRGQQINSLETGLAVIWLNFQE